MAKEHLHHLCIIFDQFREHSLKSKPSKCNFFKEEITYLAHWVSKDGVWLSNLNLKAITECTLPQTYTMVCAFLGLVDHYRRFIKGFTCIAEPLNKHLAGEGASRNLEWVSLWEGTLKAFEALKQACMTAPILAFTDYTKLFFVPNNILNNRILNFWKETSFCSLLWASSSVKKMLFLQILIHQEVYGKMFLPIKLWIMADGIAISGGC